MKKLYSKIIASVFAVAVMASATISASAADYAEDPGYTSPEIPAEVVTEENIATAVLKEEKPVVYIAPEAAAVKEDAIGLIALLNKPVTFESGDYAITVDPAKITEVKAIDLTMNISVADEAADVDGVEVPTNAVVIAPAQKGEFGMTLAVTVPAASVANVDVEKAELYYIDDDGNVTKMEDALKFDANGNAVIEISHASKYVISDVDLTAPADAGNPGDEPGDEPGSEVPPATGVAISFAVVALAGGSVASAIVAKKRK